jgi:hypothetical protein
VQEFSKLQFVASLKHFSKLQLAYTDARVVKVKVYGIIETFFKAIVVTQVLFASV